MNSGRWIHHPHAFRKCLRERQRRKVNILLHCYLNSIDDRRSPRSSKLLRCWSQKLLRHVSNFFFIFSRWIHCADSIDCKLLDNLQSAFLSVHVEIRSQDPLSSGLGCLTHNRCWLFASQHFWDQGVISKSPINERLFLSLCVVIRLPPLLIIVPKWVAEA